MAYQDYATVPTAARVCTTILTLVTISILTWCTARRISGIRNFKTLPLVSWLILSIYIDSYLFIFSSAVLNKSFQINSSTALCQAAIFLCLVCYMSTKLIIYYFLVEKVHIVRGGGRRLSSKLWCFNFFGVIIPYGALVILQFIYRIGYINKSGTCIIGMEQKALYPLIGVDLFLNIWLTSCFLAPLRQMYSYKNNQNPALRTVAVRTFIGSCATLVSCITNLLVTCILHGEAGWVCFTLCNLDILFSVLVLHWVTSIDKQGSGSSDGHSGREMSRKHKTRGGTAVGTVLDNQLDDLKPAVVTNINAGRESNDIESNGKSSSDEIDGIAVTKTYEVKEVEVQSPSEPPTPPNNYGRTYHGTRAVSGQRSDSQERILAV